MGLPSNSHYHVSICLLIKDENRYLGEWLDWHVDQGFEHFFIYDNGSKVPIRSSIPPEHADRCTVVDWSGSHVNIQFEAYNDCLERFGRLTEWLAFIDTDEFIRVVDGTDIVTFMREFKVADLLACAMVGLQR